MITIHVAINNESIINYSAVRVEPQDVDDNTVATYRTDDGHTIKHRVGDGALVLTKKMMRHWKVKK